MNVTLIMRSAQSFTPMSERQTEYLVRTAIVSRTNITVAVEFTKENIRISYESFVNSIWKLQLELREIK